MEAAVLSERRLVRKPSKVRYYWNTRVWHKPEFCLVKFSRVPEYCLGKFSRVPKLYVDKVNFYLGNFSRVPQFCLDNLDLPSKLPRVLTLMLHPGIPKWFLIQKCRHCKEVGKETPTYLQYIFSNKVLVTRRAVYRTMFCYMKKRKGTKTQINISNIVLVRNLTMV